MNEIRGYEKILEREFSRIAEKYKPSGFELIFTDCKIRPGEYRCVAKFVEE